MSVTNTKTRSASSISDHHWSTMREVGTLSGLRLLWTIHRWFGRTTVSILLRPVVLYFVLFQSQARQASRSFLTAHWVQYPDRWQRKPNFIDTLRHFREFAESVVDKLMAWHLELDQNNFHIRDQETHRRLVEDKRGQLIIGSHIGNIEYCRAFINRYKNTYN